MREFKFRIWNENESRMFEDVSLFDDDSTDTLKKLISKIQNNKCIFMQYTGEKDKNGKEIYEGDIVRQLRQDNCFGCYDKKEFTEIIRSPTYTVLTDLQSGGPDGNYPILEMEVIGNIYQNKEFKEKFEEIAEEEEGHPEGECTACYCEECDRMCLWYDFEADYCVNGPHSLDEEDIKEGCEGFENAW